jgi:hypothetical protein
VCQFSSCGQSLVDRCDILAAGLGHIRPATTATTCNPGGFANEIASIGARLDCFRTGHRDQSYFPFLIAGEDDYGRGDLVPQTVGSLAQLVCIGCIESCGENFERAGYNRLGSELICCTSGPASLSASICFSSSLVRLSRTSTR